MPTGIYLSRHAALAGFTAGACSLAFVAIAQAGTKGNPPAVHKRQSHRESYFGHLTEVAAAGLAGNAMSLGRVSCRPAFIRRCQRGHRTITRAGRTIAAAGGVPARVSGNQ